MNSFRLGGLTLTLTLVASFGLVHAQDEGLPGQPVGGGSTAAGTTTNGNGNNATQPSSNRLTPAVENAIKAKRTVGDRLRGVARDAFDPAQSGQFIGGIAVSDLATAGLHGLEGHSTARDEASDLGYALTTPEFYSGVGMFNLVYARGDKLVGKLGADYLAEAAAKENAGIFTKLVGGASGFFKENLVLAAALTIPKLVQLDFGGFNLWSATKDTGKGLWHSVTSFGGDLFHGRFGDIGHDLKSAWSPFGSEFAKLKNFSIHSSFKFDKQHLEDLGITLGSFMLAKPLWAGIKIVGKGIIERFIARQAAVAAVEGVEVAVQPEGPGEVAAVVTEAGLLGWTLFDVAKGAIDLGGLLLTANAIQKPFQNWNDHRQFEGKADEAKKNYLAVAQENGGHPDPAKLQKAMAQLATAMADLRDYHYLPLAMEDAQFVGRLKRQGVGDEEIKQLAQQVMNDDGAWLAAPGQSLALDKAFAPGTTHTGVSDQKDFDGLAKRHQEEIANLVKGLESQPKVPTSHLDPANKDFQWSQNRDQLYDEEIAILARGGSYIQDPELQKKVLQDMQIVGGLAEAEQGLLKPVQAKTPGMAAALGSGNGN